MITDRNSQNSTCKDRSNWTKGNEVRVKKDVTILGSIVCYDFCKHFLTEISYDFENYMFSISFYDTVKHANRAYRGAVLFLLRETYKSDFVL